jgi:hypothetical protein
MLNIVLLVICVAIFQKADCKPMGKPIGNTMGNMMGNTMRSKCPDVEPMQGFEWQPVRIIKLKLR